MPELHSLTTASLAGQYRGDRPASYRPLHLLLSLSSLTIVLVSINRKASFTLAFITDNRFLRWVEVNNMILGLCTVLLYYLISARLLRSNHQRGTAGAGLGIVFVFGAYFYALSLGNHEISNYLHGSICSTYTSQLCDIVAFNDDQFSDVVFLAGFTLLNVVVILTQVMFPSARPLDVWDNILVVINAMFVAAGIVANLAFERSTFDSYVVGATTLFTLVMLQRSPRQLMLRYYGIAYVLGATVTAVIKVG